MPARRRWQRTKSIVAGRAFASALLATFDSSSPLGHDLFLRAIRAQASDEIEATLEGKRVTQPETSPLLKEVAKLIKKKIETIRKTIEETSNVLHELSLLVEVNTLIKELASRDIELVKKLYEKLAQMEFGSA